MTRDIYVVVCDGGVRVGLLSKAGRNIKLWQSGAGVAVYFVGTALAGMTGCFLCFQQDCVDFRC